MPVQPQLVHEIVGQGQRGAPGVTLQEPLMRRGQPVATAEPFVEPAVRLLVQDPAEEAPSPLPCQRGVRGGADEELDHHYLIGTPYAGPVEHPGQIVRGQQVHHRSVAVLEREPGHPRAQCSDKHFRPRPGHVGKLESPYREGLERLVHPLPRERGTEKTQRVPHPGQRPLERDPVERRDMRRHRRADAEQQRLAAEPGQRRRGLGQHAGTSCGHRDHRRSEAKLRPPRRGRRQWGDRVRAPALGIPPTPARAIRAERLSGPEPGVDEESRDTVRATVVDHRVSGGGRRTRAML
ncbi:hypothetical protein MB27_23150 [Actinoplanes utahensis]|uniref:Uncharacterized protein n=1 Tax=Actinoplanes utahensis TaxID=1869 RepID=A0A0A6UM24_ACTUT|nr:hypothetical protein MB27_23150 [Actinoplanes utahensis]